MPRASEPAAMDRELVAYELHPGHGVELVPASHERSWMSSTRERFANRCLPLLMANQAGWLVVNNTRVRARWNGGADAASVEFEYEDGGSGFRPMSHFGHGIITWPLPFLFRTPPGFNLLVRGARNRRSGGDRRNGLGAVNFHGQLEVHSTACVGHFREGRTGVPAGTAAARRARRIPPENSIDRRGF